LPTPRGDGPNVTAARLALPALFALDELANVVHCASLPDQFSHYGSMGLIVMAIPQSWY
jgi:TraM recognition site of TraD and TraG